MSHYTDAARLRQECEQTGNCTGYQNFLSQEDKRIDGYAGQRIQQDVAIAGFIVLIGVFFVAAGRVPAIRRAVVNVLVAVKIALPLLLIEAGWAFAGLFIAFDSCFKQPCSGFAQNAFWILPALALPVTLPLTRWLFRKRHSARQKISNFPEKRWRFLGLLLIALALLYVGLGVLSVRETAEQSKADIRRGNY